MSIQDPKRLKLALAPVGEDDDDAMSEKTRAQEYAPLCYNHIAPDMTLEEWKKPTEQCWPDGFPQIPPTLRVEGIKKVSVAFNQELNTPGEEIYSVAAPMLGSYLFDMIELRPEEEGPLLLSDVSTAKTKEALLAYWEADRVVETNDDEAFDIWKLADLYHLDWLRLNYAGGALRYADAHNTRIDFLPHLQGIQFRTLGHRKLEPLPEKLLPVLGGYEVEDLTLDDIKILLNRVDAGMREVNKKLSFETEVVHGQLRKFSVKTNMGTDRPSQEVPILTLLRINTEVDPVGLYNYLTDQGRYRLCLLKNSVLDVYLPDSQVFNIEAEFNNMDFITFIFRHTAIDNARIMKGGLNSKSYYKVLEFLSTLTLQQPGPKPLKEKMFLDAILLFNRTVGVHGHKLEIQCDFPYACGTGPIYQIKLRGKIILQVEWTHWPKSLKEEQSHNALIRAELEVIDESKFPFAGILITKVDGWEKGTQVSVEQDVVERVRIVGGERVQDRRYEVKFPDGQTQMIPKLYVGFKSKRLRKELTVSNEIIHQLEIVKFINPMFTITFMEDIIIECVELSWNSVWHPYSLLVACFEAYSTVYTVGPSWEWWTRIQDFIALVHTTDNMFRRSFVDLAE